MANESGLSALAALGAAAMTVGILNFLHLVPFLGYALQFMAPAELLHFGAPQFFAMAQAFAGYSLAFFAHGYIENRKVPEDQPPKNTSVTLICNSLVSLVSMGVVFKFSKMVKYLAVFAAYTSGMAGVGTAIYLAWTIGMPAALGAVHYYATKSSNDCNPMDSVYFALSLSLAATVGWIAEEWKDLWSSTSFAPNPESYMGRLIETVAPSIVSPDANIIEVVGEAYTKLTFLYVGARGFGFTKEPESVAQDAGLTRVFA